MKTSHSRSTLSSASLTSSCDSDLVERLQRGDNAAYESLVRAHGGRMLAVATRMLRCESRAQDAVQDAFVAAFKSIDTFQGNSQIGTWLQRILINACLMKLRADKHRGEVPIEELLPTFDETGHHAHSVARWTGSPAEMLQSDELRAQVRERIDCLPQGYREVLMLRDLEELDTEKTAELLGLKPGAVKTRLHRARQALRTLLEPLINDSPPH